MIYVMQRWTTRLPSRMAREHLANADENRIARGVRCDVRAKALRTVTTPQAEKVAIGLFFPAIANGTRDAEQPVEPLTLEPFQGRIIMASAAIAFFVLALIAGFLGFWGLAASAAGIAKILLVVFLILAVVSMVAGRRTVAV
jgi:uncharacterized membrane protein YtjA (UPF0391 family)